MCPPKVGNKARTYTQHYLQVVDSAIKQEKEIKGTYYPVSRIGPSMFS